jgi:predicted TPR repeat methyltransferase
VVNRITPVKNGPDFWSVRNRFEDVAPHYDQSIAVYRHFGPHHALTLLEEYLGNTAGTFDILDLGCGTGFTGKYFVKHARRMIGVDLSAKMLAQAADLGIYEQLVEDEVTEFCNRSPDCFDLIVCVGMLCFLFDLEFLFAGIARMLRSGGIFIFTADRHHDGDDDGSWRLNPNAPTVMATHGAKYLDRALTATRFEVKMFRPIIERLNWRDAGPVEGWCVLAELRSP